MSFPRRVLVCGASPDNQNRNVILRSYVAEGFSQVSGVEHVSNVPLERAADKAWLVKPELVVCFGSCMPDDADYSFLKHYCLTAGAAMVFWLHDDPYEFDYSYKIRNVADLIFSNDRWCVEHYEHPRAYHLPMAASERAHRRPISTQKNINVFFCGMAFPNRIKLVRDLAKPLKDYNAVVLGDWWPESELSFCHNKRLDNDKLSDHYAQSWITLNMGRDFHYANDRFKLDSSSPGPRTFEAGMAGTTQLFFIESLEIFDHYTPGKEIVIYNSAQEFRECVESLMADHERCLAIAEAAQQRTLKDHTYLSRAKTILKHVADWRSSQ